MYYYKRLIAMIFGLVAVIAFAGAAAFFVTPYAPWFASLRRPALATSPDLHSALWFCVYLIISVSLSSAVVHKRVSELSLLAVLVATSLTYVAVLFALKELWWSTLPLAVAAAVSVALLFGDKNSLPFALIACWYVYLLALHYGYLIVN